MDFPWGTLNDSAGKMHYPPCRGLFYSQVKLLINWPTDCLDVGHWFRKHLGGKNAATAVFMVHAVINGNESVSYVIFSLS